MMLRFKEFNSLITEGRYPLWVRTTVGVIVLRIRSLSSQIDNETDPIKQNRLISQQNKLLGYINGLGIGIGTNDPKLMNRLKGWRRR
jgi:hypothetical protein